MNVQRAETSRGPRPAAEVAEKLLRRLRAAGWAAALVPIDRLRDLGDELEGRRSAGEFAPELYQERYSHFKFDVAAADANNRSILIVAAAQPHVKAALTRDDHLVSVIIPPTYSSHIDHVITEVLERTLTPAGFTASRRSLPLKLLAVRSGLARYGRNNLAYVDGMGSYCRLLGFFTDLPPQESSWIAPEALRECENCDACMRKCPTDAIDRTRFLIRADRCLTFHNERDTAFPPWVHPESHHCLVGCLYCQAYCPVNRKVAAWCEEGETLDAHDTNVILEGGPPESLSDSGCEFLTKYELDEMRPQLSRNLHALLDGPDNRERAARLLPDARRDRRKLAQ